MSSIVRVVLLITVFAWVFSLPARAGLARGHVRDQAGAGLGFAAVAVRGTALSTATNEQGAYQLRLPAGRHELVFQYVGYQTQTASVRVPAGDSVAVLDVALIQLSVQLGEVVVRSTDRDPAYALVQQAIRWRPYHQREVAAYRARTYLKSVFGLREIPGKLLGMRLPAPEPGTDPKVLRLEETVTELGFRQPGPVQERVLSTRVSGRSQEFGRGRASNQFSIYQNQQRVNIAAQALVSPIADGALHYYTYELIGTTRQDGLTLHQIRVAPRRPQTPAYSGMIYLVDGTWRLHSVQLTVSPQLLKDGFESLRVEQQYMPAPGSPDVWVLQSQKFQFSFSFLGIKGGGTSQLVYLNYRQVVPTFARRPADEMTAPVATQSAANSIQPQAPLPGPALRGLARRARQQVRRAALPADSLDLRPGEVQRVEAGANTRSAAYWDQIRPVPLTLDEQRDYRLRDSLEAHRSSRAYQDSVDRRQNRIHISRLLLTGYTWNNSFRQRRLQVAPLGECLAYNTVEGGVIHALGTYQQQLSGGRVLQLRPALRYGAAARLLSPYLAVSYEYQPQRRAVVEVGGGRRIVDFNDRTQLTPLVNTHYTLYRSRNLAKLYQLQDISLGYGRDLTAGLRLYTQVAWADRLRLQNHSAARIIDVPGREFTSNEPVSQESGPAASRSQALTLALELSWKPGQQYISQPDKTIMLGSRFPLLRLRAVQALGGILGADVRYTQVLAGLDHTQALGRLGVGQLSVTGGGFLGSPRLEFMDYRHFAGNQTILPTNFGRFQLLDYYAFSTRRQFLEGHYQQFFRGVLLNRVPLLRTLKLQEVGSVHYLHTAALGHYLEVGGGLQRDLLSLHLRADVVTTVLPGQAPRATGPRLRVWRDL
ncbi:DUF5686 and carboxypeptidase regulatory-like domain-containing protein [Hymenobacter rigui]|uniref:Carboxypeptidase-like regulatory domain-containing protein n=1 Tax=Hymenobacter rigui TaxID=334424 RepID=A0A428KM36_9BACT|nr:DUF5686 and carboxypeptidase regulatory-like domain-containing protein [Hymenobacter rigui]RSK47500.1 carboxypeptidase-like regulatory domain-containing protein [Hymenobacter rigui]